ncbi:MAG: GNAT family N-acetyltransferase [Woeseiaceae bacterium]|nr:GNAT family N-acetyltransferase [Woeseiaceae bacterium]
MLETERLTLHEMTPADAGLMLAIWNDPAFVRHVGDRGIRTLDEAQDAMSKGILRLYEEYGYGPYRVVLKDSGDAIGICGLFRRDGIDIPDIGYATLPDYCGRGYAFEAASAVIEYSRSVLGIGRLIAIISPDNAASIGLIGKLGFEFERMHRMPDDDHDVSIYGKPLNNNG